MKQNLPSAKPSRKLIALLCIAFASSGSACIKLPRHHPQLADASVSVRTSQNDPRTNINTASPRELEKLPGIGKVIAERIVAHRTEYGPFRRAEHLMMVRGISDRKFRAIQRMIVAE